MPTRCTTEEFIAKARKKFKNKYDYSEVNYINSKVKVSIKCPIHGNFLQRPNDHFHSCGCPKCGNLLKSKNYSTEEFIAKAIKVHGNKYDYSKVNYVDSNTKVTIICKEHGEFLQTPSSHLQGHGCQIHAAINPPTTEEFIAKAIKRYGDKYDYSKVNYINNKTKVTIICREHGEFLQQPNGHLNGNECIECRGLKPLTKEIFIERAREVHGNVYDYSKVDYINYSTKVIIYCDEHGAFEQTPANHINSKQKCPKCRKRTGKHNPNYKGGVTKDKLILYETYAPQLDKYQDVYKIIKDDLSLLGVTCIYCGKIFVPSFNAVIGRVSAIQNVNSGECNFYCSENCKKACPTFGQLSYPKGFKPSTSREVQPALRKMVLARDEYTCQKCGVFNNVQLHCHHIDPVVNNPIESADVDNCITLCKDCHEQVHRLGGCTYNELKCI
jgi:5-methylcytosine-specific restriction endonuclease McrA